MRNFIDLSGLGRKPGSVRWCCYLLAHSGVQATETGSADKGLHHHASNLCRCWELVFKVCICPLSAASESCQL